MDARVVEMFKEAWHAADERGEEGQRVEAGLNAVLGDLISRLRKAEWHLNSVLTRSPEEPDRLRLKGKIEGVKLALSYVEEMLR